MCGGGPAEKIALGGFGGGTVQLVAIRTAARGGRTGPAVLTDEKTCWP